MSAGAWLLVAADRREFAGVLRHSKRLHALDWPLDFASEGTLGSHPACFIANGAGPMLAARAVDTALSRGPGFARIISVGMCGGLDPSLSVGDVFVAGSVKALPGGETYVAAAPLRAPAHANGLLVSVDRVARTPEEKNELWRSHGAAAVEMEAAAVASAALSREIPFSCVRAISDAAGDGFCIDLNGARNSEGRFVVSRIVRSALRKPWEGVPELLHLAANSRRAAQNLGDFLAECEF